MKQILTNQDSPQSSVTLILAIWDHIGTRRRIQLGLLLVVMVCSGAAELLSLGSILPFLAVLSEPEKLWQQPYVQESAQLFGINSSAQLLLPFTIAFAFIAVLAAFIRLVNIWMIGRLAAAVGSDLSCEAYRRTLYQPYDVHVQRNSAEVITGSTNQISLTVVALNSLLQMITSVVVAGSLLTGLLLIDATVAVSALLLFGAVYWVLGAVSRQELRINGYKIKEASTQQLKALQEGLGAIRDVLLDNTQPIYLDIYQKADRPQRQLRAKNAFLSIFPRYAIEALGLVVIALLGGLLVLQRGAGTSVILPLGAVALGAQRLLPAMQQIYSSWSTLKGFNAAIQAVVVMLNQPLPQIISPIYALPIREGISLKGVHFSYGSDQPEVLCGVDLDVKRGQCIGLIGSTGSGKSTMVDLLMGLLQPSAGQLLVDGQDIYDPHNPGLLVSWRKAIAHVPQNIFLADSSIAENIAFGTAPHKIDFDLVRKAATQAQIANFIDASPSGYNTFVGERGIRLSGGQRQRIGIARALYKQSKILVLDEATSALDAATEQAVMQFLEFIREDLTVVMIAHRLTTVKRCDRVIVLENGLIVSDGSPHQILSFD